MPEFDVKAPMSKRASTPDGGACAVTVVITTRNRRDELCAAIDSVLRQSIAAEILVMDDASTDGTCELISSRYPRVEIIRSEVRRGLIVQRNRAAEVARGAVIVSLDDDAILTSDTTLEDAVALLREPRVGAVAIPIVNVIGGIRQRIGPPRPPGPGLWIVPVFAGGAHAIRRELFLRLAGYENDLFQWGEETNFCTKLYGSGYVVAVASCADVEHYPNPVGRHARAKNVWIYRNTVINVFLAAPWWLVAPLSLVESARHVARALRRPSTLAVTAEGVIRGYFWSIAHLSRRRPLGSGMYFAWLRLRRQKMQPLERIEGTLPPRTSMAATVSTVAIDG